MKKKFLIMMTLALSYSTPIFSTEIPGKPTVVSAEAANASSKSAEVRALEMLKNIVLDNSAFMRIHTTPYGDRKDNSYFERQTDQHTRSTVLACSDSRFHEGAIDLTPFGDDFVVRNIGNQFATSQGSTEYGVGGTEAPLLIIIGHDKCGAVTAATLGLKGLPEGALRTELELVRKSLELEGEGGDFQAHPHLTPEQELEVQKNIIKNIHAQVRLAYEKFADRIKAKKLMIVGALYDFLAERKKGEYGKLVIVNVNNAAVIDNPDGTHNDSAMRAALEEIVDRNKGITTLTELLG